MSSSTPPCPCIKHLLIFSLALTSLCHARGPCDDNEPNLIKGATPGDFDFYILATFWPAEHCHSQATEACQQPKDYWQNHFTGHGLWPNNVDGSYPGCCTEEPLNTSVTDEEIGLDTMEQYWPDLEHPPNSRQYNSLWQHEWGKHGVCTGLSQTDYFNTAIAGFKLATPQGIIDAAGQKLAIEDLRIATGGENMAVLQCSGRDLSAMFTCWSKNAQGLPDQRIQCPPGIMRESTCHADTIVIPSFDSMARESGSSPKESFHRHGHGHRERDGSLQ